MAVIPVYEHLELVTQSKSDDEGSIGNVEGSKRESNTNIFDDALVYLLVVLLC